MARTKHEHERANKWTLSLMIVIQFSKKTHSVKAGIDFVKETQKKNFHVCTYCDNTGHTRVACPAAINQGFLKRKNNPVKKNKSYQRKKYVHKRNPTNVLPK